MTITPRTRQTVLERDQHRCVRCGAYVAFGAYSIHHRLPRGMGGSKDPVIDLPGNLATLCGSGSTGCHGWVEQNRTDAEQVGLIVRRGSLPELVPVKSHRGWLRIDNEGNWRPAFGHDDRGPFETGVLA